MTPFPSPIDVAVLGRYLDGTAAPQDHAAVEAWMAADPERRAAVAALREAWAMDAGRLAAPYAADAAWTRFATRVGLRSGPRGAPHWWGGGGRRGAIAAAIVAALVGGGGAGGSAGRGPRLRRRPRAAAARRPGRGRASGWRVG